MVKIASLALSLGLLVASASVQVHGHGYMLLPVPYFPKGGDWTTYAGIIDGNAALTCPTGMSFSWDPQSNVDAYTKAFDSQTTYDSLKDLVEQKTVFQSGAELECGFTDPSGQSEALPEYVEWTHSSTEGFTQSHYGPCEVWCDNTRVFQDDNCPKNYPEAPAKLPYDKASCEGSSVLTVYWLALHTADWQVYINCAGLAGASGSSSTTNTTTPTTTTATPTTTTARPSAASASTEDEYDSDTTTTPSATTESKCNVRRRH